MLSEVLGVYFLAQIPDFNYQNSYLNSQKQVSNRINY